jgi:hypothetical protein
VNLERVNVISNSGQSHLLTWGVSDILGKNADLPFPLIIVSGFGGCYSRRFVCWRTFDSRDGLEFVFLFSGFLFPFGLGLFS